MTLAVGVQFTTSFGDNRPSHQLTQVRTIRTAQWVDSIRTNRPPLEPTQAPVQWDLQTLPASWTSLTNRHRLPRIIEIAEDAIVDEGTFGLRTQADPESEPVGDLGYYRDHSVDWSAPSWFQEHDTADSWFGSGQY